MAKAQKKQRKDKRGTNPNSLANLKPFAKGQSGNPFGMAQGTKHRGTILQKWVELETKFGNLNPKGEKIFEELGTNIKITVEDEIALALIKEARLGSVAAIREINDTLYGKMEIKTEIYGKNGGAIEFHRVIKPKANDDDENES